MSILILIDIATTVKVHSNFFLQVPNPSSRGNPERLLVVGGKTVTVFISILEFI